MRHLNKIFSVIMAVVLVASLFAMLGGFTASAETYEVSKTLVNLTFSGDAPYGIPAARIGGVEYHDGYVTLTSLETSNHSMYLGKDGTVGQTVVARSNTDDVASFTAVQQAAYDNLFIFEANKTYTVSYDYQVLKGSVSRLADGTTYTLEKEPGVMLMHNPMLKSADSNRNIARVDMIDSSVPKITWTEDDLETDAETGNEVLKADSEWVSCYYTFTVKADDPGFAWGIHANAGNGKDIYMSFDNIVIKEVMCSFEYSDSDVYTMDDEPEYINASTKTAAGSYVTDADAAHGKVLKIDGTASSYRGGFKNDDFLIIKGNKYYVTFDAKADAAGEIVVALSDHNSTTSYRHFLCGYNSKAAGVRYFIDGTEQSVTGDQQANVFALSTEWQTYGLVIDTSDEAFLAKVLANNSATYGTFWDRDIRDIHFMFGASTTAYFDNIQIVELSTLGDAVPAAVESVKYSVRDEKKAADNGGVYQSAGLRFRGEVTNTEKEAADEIGFIIAPSGQVYGDADWYDIANGVSSVAKKAVCYRKGGKDVAYSVGTDTTAYQLILTNLSKEQGGNLYARRFAAVMYVKTGDTYTYYSLGEVSYNQIKAEYAVRGY